LQGAIYLKRYDNFHVARSGVTLYGEAASTNAQNYFRFPLEQFSSPNVTPMWPRNYVYLRRLGLSSCKTSKKNLLGLMKITLNSGLLSSHCPKLKMIEEK
jgi:hypothetical protein